jgi:glutamate--cysteine ligase
VDWASELLEACGPIARRLDQHHGGEAHHQALAAARHTLSDMALLPSARVLQAMQGEHQGCFVPFVQDRSERARDAALALPLSAERQAVWAQVAATSLSEQQRLEAAQTLSFEDFRRDYVSPSRLG